MQFLKNIIAKMGLTPRSLRARMRANFTDKSVAEAEYSGGTEVQGQHYRERAMMKIPHEPPEEKPFQVQTERQSPVGAA